MDQETRIPTPPLAGSERDWPQWFTLLLRARAESLRARDETPYARLDRARQFMDRYYDQPLDLDQVARQACFSRYHFLRSFRRTFDVTPHQYLTRRRIAKAKELLTSREMSVTEVCLEVGFQSLGSFSTLFHRHVGHSPHRYRSRMVSCPGLPAGAIPACFLAVFRVPRVGPSVVPASLT